MKIWLLRRCYTLAGGAERFTQRLAEILNQKGHEVWIAAEEWPNSSKGVYQVEKIPSNSHQAYSKECLQRIASRKDGLIFSLERTVSQHIFRAGDGIHASWLKRRSRYQSFLPRLWNKLNPKHRAILELEKQVFTPQATEWVLANSSMVKQEILERFSFPEERIRVIHPGVDLSIFKPSDDLNRKNELRSGYEIPKDAVIWCFVGSGFERKGLRWAIQIAALQQKQKVYLLVLGKGKRTYYEHLAEKIGFGSRLHFLPEGTNPLDVYHTSDAFILPTIYDPCSNATLEAAACGLPVITTAANGAAEWTKGLIMDDPSLVQECAEACAAYAKPLLKSSLDSDLKAHLDEMHCWNEMLHLIDTCNFP